MQYLFHARVVSRGRWGEALPYCINTYHTPHGMSAPVQGSIIILVYDPAHILNVCFHMLRIITTMMLI